MNWKYYRETKFGPKVSKWICGGSWVTRFDNDKSTVSYGVRGDPRGSVNMTPKACKEMIELEIHGETNKRDEA